jgi:predicted DNA-binding transcriptional regulator AlpA
MILLPALQGYMRTQIMKNQFHRISDVSKLLGIAIPTIYAHISKGIWPRGIAIGQRAVAWKASEIDSMIAARTAGKSEAEIRALVNSIHDGRKLAA